ncbi:tail fiber protein [Roseateles sp. DXS20W]|uniref:Tail fiber protein n=1 Tax=Pelomonas lactea TaxID=3299030 RepID=A0ABW7GJW1_9BURK
MHRIDGPAAAPGGQFTEGDPGVGTPATVVTDDWLNAVQEEIASVVEATGVALAKPNNAQLLAAIRTLVAAALPPGAIQAFAVSVVPEGWLECNGGTFAAAAHPALAAALGTTWGAAPAGQIRLPDLRGEFLRGWDNGRGVDVGRALASSQADQIERHKHLNCLGEAGAGSGFFGTSNTGGRQGTNGTDYDNYWYHTNDGSDYDGVVNPAGVIGNETRPRNVAVLYCIKV